MKVSEGRNEKEPWKNEGEQSRNSSKFKGNHKGKLTTEGIRKRKN
jgi:hypothetical protein